MDNATVVQQSQMAGLFLLKLQSEPSSGAVGAPTLNLTLTIDTVFEIADGGAVITQALEEPIVCTSHVYGPVIDEYVMPPGESKIRIDLTGHQRIVWPDNGGIDPVLLPNFKAMVLLETDYQQGIVVYQYPIGNGPWVKIEQEIEAIS